MKKKLSQASLDVIKKHRQLQDQLKMRPARIPGNVKSANFSHVQDQRSRNRSGL